MCSLEKITVIIFYLPHYIVIDYLRKRLFSLYLLVGVAMLNEKYWYHRETGEAIGELTPTIAIKDAIENGLIKEAYQVIGQGKEAFVFWGKDFENRLVAVKSYKIHRTTHRETINKTFRSSPYEVISQFAKLEYYKTLDMFKLGLSVPQPYNRLTYSFSMELIGDADGPAPLLGDIKKDSLISPDEILEQVIEILHNMFQSQWVHGDFSEHNLMLYNDKIYVIDFLQSKNFALKDAVPYGSNLIALSRAFRILHKDLKSILPFFKRCYRLSVDYNEVLNYIIGNYKKKIDKVLEDCSESSYSEFNKLS